MLMCLAFGKMVWVMVWWHREDFMNSFAVMNC